MLFRFLRGPAIAAALAIAASAPAAAQVPDPFARQLAQQLTLVDQVQSQYGYSRAAGPFAGGLAPTEARRFPVTLRAGQPYRMVGVCDARCADIDLRLFDPNGVLVTQDRAPDRTPLVELSPPSTGAYTIELAMAQCAEAPCYFAFNVYSR